MSRKIGAVRNAAEPGLRVARATAVEDQARGAGGGLVGEAVGASSPHGGADVTACAMSSQ